MSTQIVELKRSDSLLGSWYHYFFQTTIGSKMLMAVTGLGLWVFIIAHLAGNLTAFLGRDTFNAYAAALMNNPPLLWFVRICLIVGFPLHIFSAIRTAQLNRQARPQQYVAAVKTPIGLSARTMLITGLLVLAFFIYHLAHFTFRVTGPQPVVAPGEAWDPYAMLVLGFQQPIIAGLYVVAQVLLALHLSHGIYSLFQHLGLYGRRWTPFIKATGFIVGYGISLAFIAIPVAVQLGVIK